MQKTEHPVAQPVNGCCNAKTRKGTPCQIKVIYKNGRCKLRLQDPKLKKVRRLVVAMARKEDGQNRTDKSSNEPTKSCFWGSVKPNPIRTGHNLTLQAQQNYAS